jgi:capsule polysaccharide export protein KpsE/RkpR
MKALKETALLAEQESLTRSFPNHPSLNTVLMNHDRAQLEVRMAQDVLENALTSLNVATRDAAQNQSLLIQIVPPTTQSTPVGPQTLPTLLLVLLLSVTAFSFVQLLRSDRFDGRL